MTPENEKKIQETKAAKNWALLGVKHHHGINVPLFSLHSEKSSGIGEYPDLLLLIDLCVDVGMDVIQLLPLNDLGKETSPYFSLSAFALNPLHLGLTSLPAFEKVPDFTSKLSILHSLNNSLRVNYKDVFHHKFKFLEDYFTAHFPTVSQTQEYEQFIQKHSWLESYALFKAIKEKQQWQSWESWPASLKSPSEKGLQELLVQYRERVHFHSFLQYLCFSQMAQVKKRATERGVFIKGDIPILLNRDSADVWGHRSYFLLEMQAGAPPDMYAPKGQNWGFPLYDWHALEKERFVWWKERLKVAEELYHLYRLDHVVGFSRIWSIPLGRKAVEGSFSPSEKSQWIAQGRKILEMLLEASTMLPIAEDLGIVPPEVRGLLQELGIPGTKVLRWERNWETDGSFIDPQAYSALSMTTVSTHDSDPLQLWWRHAAKEAKLFAKFKEWDYRPFLTYEQHRQLLWDSHHSSSLFHINLLLEYLALFPELISSNPQDERINVPGKVLASNWTYRVRPSLEQLLDNTKLKRVMKNLKD